jgi:hypothetical protein
MTCLPLSTLIELHYAGNCLVGGRTDPGSVLASTLVVSVRMIPSRSCPQAAADRKRGGLAIAAGYRYHGAEMRPSRATEVRWPFIECRYRAVQRQWVFRLRAGVEQFQDLAEVAPIARAYLDRGSFVCATSLSRYFGNRERLDGVRSLGTCVQSLFSWHWSPVAIRSLEPAT